MNHPETRWRALASAVSVLCVAYFVWWGCFAGGVPLPNPCGGLCCTDCACCVPNSGPTQPYCSLPDEACVIRCDPPNTVVSCECARTQSFGQCRCDANGVVDVCDQIFFCGTPGGTEFCTCPATGASGMCRCNADNTMDPCAFIM